MSTECGVYFTSSPGYSVYADEIDNPASGHVAHRARLREFWGADVDSNIFFFEQRVQSKFCHLLASICECFGLEEKWTVMFGEGPFSEPGGMAVAQLRESQTTKVHDIANAVAYLLQQVTLYYYIGEECFVSRCKGPWTDVKRDRPVPTDWTSCATLSDELALDGCMAAISEECNADRVTVVYQPKTSEIAVRLKDDVECITQTRVSAVVELCLDNPIDEHEHRVRLARVVRERLPAILRAHHAEQLSNGTLQWIGAETWSQALYVLWHPSSQIVICRREVHPWYDSFTDIVAPFFCILPGSLISLPEIDNSHRSTPSCVQTSENGDS